MRIYNKDGGDGVIVSAHGRFPVTNGCAEVPEAALEDVMRNKDWQPWNGQVPWPGKEQPKTAAKAETPKDPGQAPTDGGTGKEGASAPSFSLSESPKPEKPAKPGKRSGSGGKSK